MISIPPGVHKIPFLSTFGARGDGVLVVTVLGLVGGVRAAGAAVDGTPSARPPPADAPGPGEGGENCLSWDLGPVPGGREASTEAQAYVLVCLCRYIINRSQLCLRALYAAEPQFE